jgi:chromosome partitioning protein
MDGETSAGGGDDRTPYVIVVGNEKGGTGKSTTAVHLAIALIKAGYKVGTIDLDARQGTLTRYLANRRAYGEAIGVSLPAPHHVAIERSASTDEAGALEEEHARLVEAMASLSDCDFVVIDTPGSDSRLSRAGHAFANTLITPINDSFLDIDVLARVDHERREVTAPSIYTKTVWEHHNRRILEGKSAIDWIVMRNRLTHIDSRNKRDISDLLERLSARIGFRIAPGFGERVVFRELFPDGLTLLDKESAVDDGVASASRAAAKKELAGLLHAIGLPESVLT